MAKPDSYTSTWGCLGTGMVLFGAWFVGMLHAVGGSADDLEYAAIAMAVGGVAILAVVIAKHLCR